MRAQKAQSPDQKQHYDQHSIMPKGGATHSQPQKNNFSAPTGMPSLILFLKHMSFNNIWIKKMISLRVVVFAGSMQTNHNSIH